MSDIHDQRLIEEARAWLLRLRDEDTSVEDFAQWHKWLATSERHREAYGKVEAVWVLASSAGNPDLWPSQDELENDAFTGEISVSDYLRKTQSPSLGRAPTTFLRRVRRERSAALAMAAVCLVVAAITAPVAIHFLVPARPLAVMEVVTQRGETRAVHLPDGSNVDLGGSSDLKVDFSGGNRRMTLAAGEGYFKVAHDKQHPFVVTTRLGQVVAVGTEFDVRLARDHVVVSVTEGRVNVSAKLNRQLTPDETAAREPGVVQIAAGEAVVLASLPTRVAISTQPALPPSWREGRLAYRAEPLKYVVSDLNRYSTNQIIISDPKVGEFEYSGTVTPGALDDWVVALTQAFPVTVEKQTDGAYVISAR